MGVISKAKDAKARFDSIVKIDPVAVGLAFAMAKGKASLPTFAAAQVAILAFKAKIIKEAAAAAYAIMDAAQKLIADAKAAAEAEAAAAAAEATAESGKYAKP